jgi:hypothetical protein
MLDELSATSVDHGLKTEYFEVTSFRQRATLLWE